VCRNQVSAACREYWGDLMPNWCENEVLIRGPAEDIRKYRESLLKDATGKYYPYFSTVPLPELKDEAEVQACIEKGYENKTVFGFSWRAIDMEVVETSPEELELHLLTAYSPAKNLCTEDLFPKLSILHKYFEPMMAYHGFAHYVKGKRIASGHEESEEQDSLWEMYNYAPWPAGMNPLKEKLRDYIIIPADQLRPMEELIELLKKEKQ
jgi:hypothetical protein